jgi:hypothetical protein
MRALILAGLFLPALAGRGQAQIPPSVGAQPGLLCRAAIQVAERGTAIPPHLMAAIARVESGRPDPATGEMNPWPWTINAEGQGMVFATKAQAITAVRALQAKGMRSIDVGCMQVNLMHHPQAFASLEQAFDPQANARYAARFLIQLFEQSGAWPIAAAHYHSATPVLAADYSRKVLAVWPEEKRRNDGARLTLAYGWATALMAGGPGTGGGLLPPTGGGLLPPSRSGSFPTARLRRGAGVWDGGLLRPSYRPAHVTMAFYRSVDGG